ncbi:MAG: hypothetical protein V3W41_22875 [Planctomycetota bacterium]
MMQRTIGAWLLLATLTLAQQIELTLDGETVVQKQPGTQVELSIDGTANAEYFLALDVSPGPSIVFGQSVDLGFTPGWTLLANDFLPPSGILTVNSGVPQAPSLVGVDFFLLSAEIDAAAPGGIAFSNGVQLSIVAPQGFTRTALAGIQTGNAPGFSPVQSFFGGNEIHLGANTQRFPFLAGKTVDLYLVPAKDAATWAIDTSLNDVSCDGIDTVQLDGSGLSNNVYLLDAGCAAPANAVPIGMGYDVVIDVDRDGQLGDGDFIDGAADQAGCYVLADTTIPGPHPVIEVTSGGGFSARNVFYPADIAQLTSAPLVVVSHGNGHDYRWYDHIGFHLASYGYVVMSHANNTGPGPDAAALTTISNTDAFIGSLGSFQGGILNGKVDPTRMTWIGHSRGGEGVAIAYRRVSVGLSNPINFSASDISLVSSIAPTTFFADNVTNPLGVNFHLWVGSADSDVLGCPFMGFTGAVSYPLLTRATAQTQATVVQGAGHDNFHNSGGALFFGSGPNQLTRLQTHSIMLGHLLPMVEYHVRGNLAAKDFLVREWENFHPPSAPTAIATIVNHTFREDPNSADVMVIEDYQTSTTAGTSSAGDAVTATVTGLTEGRLVDTNFSFTHNVTEPFNGFPQTELPFTADNPRGGIFSFNSTSQEIHYDLSAAPRDISAMDYLSLKAAQQPRHPLTTQELGQVTFEVRLTDGLGRSATVSIGSYGGGISEPYQRTGCGTGTGWAAEFETIRMPLPDFLGMDGSLDLTDIQGLTLLFGSDHGSSVGRICLDEILIAKN